MQKFVFSSQGDAGLVMKYCSAGQKKFLSGCLKIKRELHSYEMQLLPCGIFWADNKNY